MRAPCTALLSLALVAAAPLAAAPQSQGQPSTSDAPAENSGGNRAGQLEPTTGDDGARTYSVLVLDLQPTNAPPEEVRLITDLIASSLSQHRGLSVLTSADITQALGLEAQKQSLGCTDESCLAELAGALGAELVVGGSVGKLGSLTVVNLSFFDSRAARSAGRKSIEVRDLEELPAAVRGAVIDIVADIAPDALSSASEPGAAAPADEGGLSPLLLAGGVTAGVGALGVLGFGAAALVFDAALGDVTVKGDDKGTARWLGWSALGLTALSGAVLVGGGVALGLGMGE